MARVQNMTQSEIRTPLPARRPQQAGPVDADRWVRVIARWRARQLDLDVDHGTAVAPSSALAVHLERLGSTREREQLADSLELMLSRARRPHFVLSPVPLQRDSIHAARPLIDAIQAALRSESPVRARGMARLRLLMSDGAGPLYRAGRGSLVAALRGVLATL